jgi:hypothetical protein
LRIVGAGHKAVGLAIYARKRPDQRSGRSTPSCILASLRQRLTGAPLRGVAARQREEVHIANAERVDHRGRRLRRARPHAPLGCWRAADRLRRHVLPALPPEFADGPLRSWRSEVQGGSQTSSTLSGVGTFQSRYFAAALAGPRLLVMVLASRRAQHPGLTRFGA